MKTAFYWILATLAVAGLCWLIASTSQAAADSCRARGGKVIKSYDSKGNYIQGCIEP